MSEYTIIQMLDRQRRQEQNKQPPGKWQTPLLVALALICASYLAGYEHALDKRQKTIKSYCSQVSIFSKNPLCDQGDKNQ